MSESLHPDTFLLHYLEQLVALKRERQALERDYEARCSDLENVQLTLEANLEDEVLQALEARGGQYAQGEHRLRLEPAHLRVRVLDESALLEWLYEHRPQWVRRTIALGPLLHALKPEGEGLRDRETGATVSWPPGLEAVSARARIHLDTFT